MTLTLETLEQVPVARQSRQSAIIAERTKEAQVVVVGAGMLGSWVTATLARYAGHVHLWDDDAVEPENLGCQMYGAKDIGDNKAQAVAEMLLGLPITAYPARMEDLGKFLTAHPCDVVVSAVDTMAGRRAFATAAMKAETPLFVDTRATGETAAVLTAYNKTGYKEYLAALFRDEDIPDGPCGERGTSYVGMWVGSYVGALVNKFFQGRMPEPMITYHVGIQSRLDK